MLMENWKRPRRAAISKHNTELREEEKGIIMGITDHYTLAAACELNKDREEKRRELTQSEMS